MMKIVFKPLLAGFTVMILITYSLGLLDDAFRKTGIWYKDLLESFKYYILWVVPYWWLIIIFGAIIIASIIIVVKKLAGKIF